jgi:hypothetical protein
MDVAICTGKSCRRRVEHKALRAALPGRTVAEVSCLGICKGPVVALAPTDDVPIVIARVRSPKAIRDVARVARGERPLSKRLRERMVTGARRTKALRRLVRAMHH